MLAFRGFEDEDNRQKGGCKHLVVSHAASSGLGSGHRNNSYHRETFAHAYEQAHTYVRYFVVKLTALELDKRCALA